MKNGKIKYLEPDDLDLLNAILQCEKVNIDAYISRVTKYNYKKQCEFSNQGNSSKLKKFSDEEAMIGEFTSVIFLSNQNYIIGYLNTIIHSLMNSL